MVERRVACDGKLYTQDQFRRSLMMLGPSAWMNFWDTAGPEKRRARDGNIYTKQEFINWFGQASWHVEWTNGVPTAALGEAETEPVVVQRVVVHEPEPLVNMMDNMSFSVGRAAPARPVRPARPLAPARPARPPAPVRPARPVRPSSRSSNNSGRATQTKPCGAYQTYCKKCEGTGWMHDNATMDCEPDEPGDDHCFFCQTCTSCGGKGVHDVTVSGGMYSTSISYNQDCSKCKGTGWYHANTFMDHDPEPGQTKCFFCKKCAMCGGKGCSLTTEGY